MMGKVIFSLATLGLLATYSNAGCSTDGCASYNCDGLVAKHFGVENACSPKPAPAPAPKATIPVAPKAEKDSDGDGVYDNSDACPNTPRGVKVDKNGCPVSYTFENIEFDFNKAVIKDSYMDRIHNISGIMTKYGAYKAVVTGHTDSIGSEAYNLKLSKKRAEAVKAAIVKSGHIDPMRIKTVGKGESEPIATNKTREGRAKNRRVEINFITE